MLQDAIPSQSIMGHQAPSHLSDPSALDPYVVDELGRRGPKFGIFLSRVDAATVLSRLSEQLEVYKVSSLGYNNRLYWATTASGGEFVIKVCGRFWRTVKTETEVVGVRLASRLGGTVPVPCILAFDSNGSEFKVEYTIMRRTEGVQLAEVWEGLTFDAKRDVIGQLGKIVVAYRSISGGAGVGGSRCTGQMIGNFRICSEGEENCQEFRIGKTLEGLGPWSTYEAYLREQMEVKIDSARCERGMERMMPLLPRVEKFLETLKVEDDDDEDFVFTHCDLTLQNLLVSFVDKRPTITAVLDWEWSGMFPAEEEFFCSFDFILNDEEKREGDEDRSGGDSLSQLLRSYFFSVLEEGGVGTPRTLPKFQQRKDLYDLKENLYPWYIADCDDVTEAVDRAFQEVERLLNKLNL